MNSNEWTDEMIIVSGRIYVQAGTREGFIASSAKEILQARQSPGCRDFVIAADPFESDRVNVYEEWDSVEDLLAFRGSGPDKSMRSVIEHAVVSRHNVSSSGPA